jgi:hypothetical protein
MISLRDEPSLPGQELVEQGLDDLRHNRITEASLLILVAAPRLRDLGIAIPHRTFPRPSEHELYELLEKRLGAGAHSHYNSLIRRIVSFARALEREKGKASNSNDHIPEKFQAANRKIKG